MAPSKNALSPKTITFAASALVLAAMVQLATTWMQIRYLRQEQAECSCGGSSSSASESSSSSGFDFEKEYSWVGDDYPPFLPIDLGGPVALVLEDSRHYALTSPDADAEWESIYPGRGLGFVRLGPNKRFFSLSLYHQIHCLDSLRRAVLGKSHHHGRGMARDGDDGSDGDGRMSKRDVEHSAHCLNYLRQSALCAADLTLEPEIEEGSQEVGEGLAATHVCRDWSKVHDFVKRNWEEWEEWQRTNRSRYT